MQVVLGKTPEPSTAAVKDTKVVTALTGIPPLQALPGSRLGPPACPPPPPPPPPGGRLQPPAVLGATKLNSSPPALSSPPVLAFPTATKPNPAPAAAPPPAPPPPPLKSKVELPSLHVATAVAPATPKLASAAQPAPSEPCHVTNKSPSQDSLGTHASAPSSPGPGPSAGCHVRSPPAQVSPPSSSSPAPHQQQPPEYCSTLLAMMTEEALETDLCQHVVTLINR